MKMILSLPIILISFLCYGLCYSQSIPDYPIPSYNIEVTGYANFLETYGKMKSLDQILEKRQVNVQIKSVTHGCQATVWVYALDRTTVLGPYTVTCDNILTVEIDDRYWGVLVETEDDLLVSVWFGQSDKLTPEKIKSRNTIGFNIINTIKKIHPKEQSDLKEKDFISGYSIYYLGKNNFE